jgi:F-type H+-transporting ATPase subunit delta
MASENKNRDSAFDTDRQYLGAVYARALLGMADKSGQVEEIVAELGSFADALGKLPALRTTLESPRIALAEKNQLLEKALQGKASPAFLNFLKVVVSKGRANCLGAIRRAADAMCDERAGRVQATMVTAQAVDEATRQRVAGRLQEVLGKQVLVTAEVDPSVLGGLVVRVGDTIYDGSLKNQLSQVRAAAIGRANQEIRKSLDRFASGA